MTAALPSVLFVWDQFGPYHMDRCEAVAAALADRAEVVGIELAATSRTYAWDVTGPGRGFAKRTLFGGGPAETLRPASVAAALVREVSRPAVRAVFLAGYERPSHFVAATAARLRGRRAIVMLDSKYDDRPRRRWVEAGKRALMAPYSGGFAAGRRSAEYLRLLGLRDRMVTLGYDSVSLGRIRALAGDTPARPWAERPFLAVARYVPKKNLDLLIHAYAAFRAAEPGSPRRLVLCGGGPLEPSLRAAADGLGVGGWVDFTGFVGQAEVTAYLKDALCLLLPSVEEQWGLVVNEALAFDLPVVLATGVGATDLLAEDGGNGLVLDPHDAAGWTGAMRRIGSDRLLWARMSARSAELAPLGDVGAFVRGVLPHLPFAV